MAEDVTSQALAALRDLSCWQVGLSYGSVLRFELGDKLASRTDPLAPEWVGEATLWLYGDDWEIRHSGAPIASSDSIDIGIVEERLQPVALGRVIQEITPSASRISVSFSEGLSVSAWRPQDAEIGSDEDLITLFLPDGRIVFFSEEKGLSLSTEIDELRAGWWRGRPTP